VGGQETILLVDDEIEVRNLGKELLESFGYEVILACNGSEAIEIYNNKLANINLVILDLSMPKKSGRETLKELLEINKEVKVIVSSGYDKGGPVMGLLKMGAKSFVQKPYKIDKMLQEVRKVLDAKLEK
jgi:DNA-binding NtrC family response regulator